MTIEEWRPIPQYPGYFASSSGRVKGPRGIRKPFINRDGYGQITVYLGNYQEKLLLVHHAVLFAFKGPKPDNMEGCHDDGDPSNNTPDNLYWGTQISNASDRKRHGRDTTNGAKLSEIQVLEIRRAHDSGISVLQLMKQYNLGSTTVYNIVKGKTWKGLRHDS